MSWARDLIFGGKKDPDSKVETMASETVPTKTRQWTTKQDGMENLEMREVDLPALGEGDVLVKIAAVSLNYRDTEGMPSLPFPSPTPSLIS